MSVGENDPWVTFRRELRRSLAEQNMTQSELAFRLGGGVSESTVKNWLKVTRPHISHLPKISAILKMGATDGRTHDPTYLFRQMGLLPPDDSNHTYATAYRVQKLEMRLREAIERTAAYGRDVGALYGIIQAVQETKEWAIAVWPAIEGPADCRMHVADRLDLRRMDGRNVDAKDVTSDPILFRALRDGYAIPATRQPRWSPQDDPSVSRWSLMRVGHPSSPFARTPHPGFQSIFCYSTVVDSWVNDIASLLATALGYGLTTTRDLALEAHGSPLGDLWHPSRSQAHRYLLANPPRRRVWSHHSPSDEECPDPFDSTPGVPCVWVRESDDLLAHASERRGIPLKTLMHHRDRVEHLAERRNGSLLIVADADFRDSPDERWRQVLETVLMVFQRLEDERLLSPDTRGQWVTQSEWDHGVAAPALAWLGRHLRNERR